MKIVLIGKMRSGKDTVADYLVEKYNYTRYAFGDELKRYYHELFGETDSKPREGYQWLGQTMRQRKSSIWVDKCFEKINRENKENIVVTDLRQPNEYDKCNTEEFVLVKIHCDDDIRIRRIKEKNDNFNEKDLYHETEMHIDTYHYDYLINNDGNLEDLYSKIDRMMEEVNVYA